MCSDFLRTHGPALLEALDSQRAIEEQAAVTECVSVNGRNPSDVIRDVVSWHCSMNEMALHNEYASVLPGPQYMDPPDGGDVSVVEQLRRMAKDAERWNRLKAMVDPDEIPGGLTIYLSMDDKTDQLLLSGDDVQEAIDRARGGGE